MSGIEESTAPRDNVLEGTLAQDAAQESTAPLSAADEAQHHQNRDREEENDLATAIAIASGSQQQTLRDVLGPNFDYADFGVDPRQFASTFEPEYLQTLSGYVGDAGGDDALREPHTHAHTTHAHPGALAGAEAAHRRQIQNLLAQQTLLRRNLARTAGLDPVGRTHRRSGHGAHQIQFGPHGHPHFMFPPSLRNLRRRSSATALNSGRSVLVVPYRTSGIRDSPQLSFEGEMAIRNAGFVCPLRGDENVFVGARAEEAGRVLEGYYGAWRY